MQTAVNLYLDSSSFLKLFLEEDGSSHIAEISSSAERVSISAVGYSEARSALARARLGGRIQASDYDDILQRFEQTWATFNVPDVTEPLVRLAGDLAEKYVLRGFDAIHLASAVTLQRKLGEPITFSAFDDRLSESAASEGLLLP